MHVKEIGKVLAGSMARVTKELSVFQQLQYAPILAQVILTRRCNLGCRYCNEFDKNSPPVTAEDLYARIDKLSELGTVAIEFSGGEPLLHPDLGAILAYATKKQFLRRMLITNGMLLTRELIEMLNESGLQHMQISIDGVSENSVTVKVLNELRPKLELLKKYKRFAVTVNSVIGAAPPAEVAEVFYYTKSLGFRSRVLVVHDRTGQVKLSDNERSLYRELTESLPRRKVGGGAVEKFLAGAAVPFKCRAGARYLYVDEFGQVRYCSQQRAKYGKSLLEFTARDLRANFYAFKACHARCSIGCARNCSALDQWRYQEALG